MFGGRLNYYSTIEYSGLRRRSNSRSFSSQSEEDEYNEEEEEEEEEQGNTIDSKQTKLFSKKGGKYTRVSSRKNSKSSSVARFSNKEGIRHGLTWTTPRNQQLAAAHTPSRHTRQSTTAVIPPVQSFVKHSAEVQAARNAASNFDLFNHQHQSNQTGINMSDGNENPNYIPDVQLVDNDGTTTVQQGPPQREPDRPSEGDDDVLEGREGEGPSTSCPYRRHSDRANSSSISSTSGYNSTHESSLSGGGTDKSRGFGSKDNDEDEDRQTSGPRSALRTLAFGVGHFYNDLCACLWFSFLVIFSEKVLMLSAIHAGIVILVGQVTDAIATPTVGLLSDNITLPHCFQKYGKRKTVHLIGTVLVSGSFPFIFNCLICNGVNDDLALLYLLPFVMVFQIGWASVQVSHLSLIPQLARCRSTRTTLNALRFVFTVVAQVSVFALVIHFLGIDQDKLSPKDAVTFRRVDYIVVGIGIITSIIFHLGTTEPDIDLHNSDGRIRVQMTVWCWFREPRFYLTATLYMCSRLYINVSQVYMGLYVEYTQNRDKKFVAIIPLIVCLSSFIVSGIIGLPWINRQANNKVLYLFGGAVGCSGCVWMYYQNLTDGELYGLAGCLGVAQALLLVTSLAITADLIANNTESGAFVYGAMSFGDKLFNGITYQIIQFLDPSCEEAHSTHSHCARFYQSVMVWVPLGAVSVALLLLIYFMVVPRKDRDAEELVLIDDESDDRLDDNSIAQTA